MDDTLKITRGQDGGDGVLLRLDGVIDLHSAPELLPALRTAFAAASSALVVDLSGVRAIDSSGIATLVEGLRWSRQQGRRFVLRGVGDSLRDAFRINGLEEAFSFE